MKREDANAIALHAVRQILDAARSCVVALGDFEAQCTVEERSAGEWPDAELEGLDSSQHGPWPRAVNLIYAWPGGSARLRAFCHWWKRSGAYRHLVGISVRHIDRSSEFMWTTFGLAVQKTPDGDTAPVFGTLGFHRHKPEESSPEWRRWRDAIRRQADVAGLPRPTPAQVELCRIAVPDGQVLPSPEAAFERIARLALLKLVVLGRADTDAYAGEPPFRVSAEPEKRVPAEPAKRPTKRAALSSLPGGVRLYMETLEALLTLIEEQAPDRDALYQHLTDQWDVNGATTLRTSVDLLLHLGFVDEGATAFALTDAGAFWLSEPTAEALFDVLHATYEGMIELLVLLDERGPLRPHDGHLLRSLLGTTWQTFNQVDFRRNWLLSMGLSTRDRDGDRLTAAGQKVLDAHDAEVAAIRPRIAALPSVDALEAEPAVDQDDNVAEDPLVLLPAVVRQYLGDFRPPPRVIEQCCAALSAGRHLLLVGPPGTGKTRLAGILAAAAEQDGYCNGQTTTTASADWTTFDTIGGYALTRGSELRFRPGIFPRALAERRWLVVDELNRADIDKAFGELMTVLAGGGTTAPYQDDEDRSITIGPGHDATFRVWPAFRVIATMNTWDKTSLFRLSAALQRRFATVHVGLPSRADYQDLIETEALKPPAVHADLTRVVVDLFRRDSLLKYRAIGPAIPLEIIRYIRHRQDQPRGRHAVAEAITVSLLSQLEGLAPEDARAVVDLLHARLQGISSDESWADLHARLLELFPLLARL